MALYPPPNEFLPIFDPSVFDVPINNQVIDEAYLAKNYLKFPLAQGTENFGEINVAGVSDFNSVIRANADLEVLNNITLDGATIGDVNNTTIGQQTDGSLLLSNNAPTNPQINLAIGTDNNIIEITPTNINMNVDTTISNQLYFVDGNELSLMNLTGSVLTINNDSNIPTTNLQLNNTDILSLTSTLSSFSNSVEIGGFSKTDNILTAGASANNGPYTLSNVGLSITRNMTGAQNELDLVSINTQAGAITALNIYVANGPINGAGQGGAYTQPIISIPISTSNPISIQSNLTINPVQTYPNTTNTQYLSTIGYVNQALASIGASYFVGQIITTVSQTAPAGNWLLCQGQSLNAVSNPQYQALYNAIGTSWGGTGNTAFYVPNFTGLALVGAQTSTGFPKNSLGTNTGGQASVNINATPPHTHDNSISNFTYYTGYYDFMTTSSGSVRTVIQNATGTPTTSNTGNNISATSINVPTITPNAVVYYYIYF